MDATEFALRALPILLVAGNLIWTVVAFRAGVRKTELTQLSNRIDTVADDLLSHKTAGIEWRTDLRERVVKIEGTLEQLPTKDVVHDLALSVTAMRGEVGVQGAKLTAMAASTARIEEFLLDRGRDR